MEWNGLDSIERSCACVVFCGCECDGSMTRTKKKKDFFSRTRSDLKFMRFRESEETFFFLR